jgi:transposase
MMRSNLFWLDDNQWQQIEPHLPTDVRGKERADDRRVISGILHVLRSGCRWKDWRYHAAGCQKRSLPRWPEAV